MDTTGENLHPNWQALATVDFPLKRFVRPTEAPQNSRGPVASRRLKEATITGTEARQYYVELLNETPSARPKKPCHQMLTRAHKVEPPKQPFEQQKYFRYAQENDVQSLQQLDYKGVDVNVRDQFAWTALMMAACAGALEAATFLIKLGVDPHAKDKRGNTALSFVAHKANNKAWSALLCKAEKRVVPKTTESSSKSPIFCDTCRTVVESNEFRRHQTSVVHQFNMQPREGSRLERFNIPERNRGLQLMVQQGWDKESGLGPTQSGRLYPVKTVIRQQRTGLGTRQPPARVTHFGPCDPRATQGRRPPTAQQPRRNRNDMKREKIRDWKLERSLRNELS